MDISNLTVFENSPDFSAFFFSILSKTKHTPKPICISIVMTPALLEVP